jgi:succinate dehydrogenase/fumarate reductase flavoprotein subunit
LSALEFVQKGVARPASASLAENAQGKIRALFQRSGGGETVAGLRKEMLHTMEEHAGIYRSGAGLAAACAKLGELRRRYRNLELHARPASAAPTCRRSVGSIPTAPKPWCRARRRAKSRGRQHLEFPERDSNYLRHSMPPTQPTARRKSATAKW